MAEALEIALYMRPGCHLCDDVAEYLEEIRHSYGIIIRTIDITSDLELHSEMWVQIPVVKIGQTMLRAPIHPVRLQAALLRALRGQQSRQGHMDAVIADSPNSQG